MYAKEFVENAASKERYLSSRELEQLNSNSSQGLGQLTSLIAESSQRMEIVIRITNNSTAIVADSTRLLFLEERDLITSGGNAYNSRLISEYLRKLGIILRCITYTMVAGNSDSLADWKDLWTQKTDNAPEIPGSSIALAIKK